MKKQIITTTLSGLFVKSEPWKKAHILWFKDASEKLKDNSINEWVSKPNYFEGVDIIMRRLYPNLAENERTIKARETYFDSVIRYINKKPEVINKNIINYFISLKEKYQIALITTNKKDSIDKILKMTNLFNLFDIIESSKPEEKDDKIIVFERFIKKYGKPLVYIGGDKKDSFDYCLKNNIPCIFANLENSENIQGVKTIYNLKELKSELEKLIYKF